MIIKKKVEKKKTHKIINKFLLYYFLLSLILISSTSFILINSAKFKIEKSELLDKISRAGRLNYIHLPQILYGALKSKFHNFEKIKLDMSFEDILIIENLRDQSLKKQSLPPRHLIPKINIDIRYNDQKLSGDARLKGDRIDHYRSKKETSYKVELDKGNYLFGMKKFSIQKPFIRNYIHEWIFHELSKEFGIIKLTYEFIDLYLNGENYGLFVLEEGFGKELIERNNRRNGPIFSLNEDLHKSNLKPIFEIYNKKYWESEQNRKIVSTAAQKLRNFFENEEVAENIFDLDKWASYFAIIDLTGTWHGALLKSVKFYYNPISGLFEPIPFDGHRFKPNFSKYNLSYDNKLLIDYINQNTSANDMNSLTWLRKFFLNDDKLNQKFYDLYVKKLTLISSEKFIENFLNKNLKKINKINSQIYGDSFWHHIRLNKGGLYYFSLNDFYYQSQNIANKLNRKGGLQVILDSNKETLKIKDHFDNYARFYIDKLICKNSSQIIEISIDKDFINFGENNFNISREKLNDANCDFIKFVNKNSNESFLQKIDYVNSDYNYINFKKKNDLKFKKYFTKKGNKLFLNNEKEIINENLFIPDGFEVIIKQNQKLFLIDNAFIISYSPWKIGGNDSTTYIGGTKDNLGGGIIVKNNKKSSIIKNTKFSYLNGFPMNELSEFIILGSINFYETNVKIDDTHFENIFSEDAINVFRSKFEITNNTFNNIFSDAIDIDFSKGKIELSKFENVNNDAIDFSGSIATIENVEFNNINDKIISVGEKSEIDISKVSGKNSHAGIVSKDGSFVTSNQIKFDNVLIPFSAYQKKKEYDYGSLVVTNSDLNNFHTKWLKDKGSSIIIDEKRLDKITKLILPIINEKKLELID